MPLVWKSLQQLVNQNLYIQVNVLQLVDLGVIALKHKHPLTGRPHSLEVVFILRDILDILPTQVFLYRGRWYSHTCFKNPYPTHTYGQTLSTKTQLFEGTSSNKYKHIGTGFSVSH